MISLEHYLQLIYLKRVYINRPIHTKMVEKLNIPHTKFLTPVKPIC